MIVGLLILIGGFSIGNGWFIAAGIVSIVWSFISLFVKSVMLLSDQ